MSFHFDVIGKTFGPHEHTYEEMDVILYALGSGATVDELDYLYEPRGPKVLPTFSVVPAFVPLHESLLATGGNMLTLVHGAQKCTLHRPIPASGKLVTTAKIDGIYDKGKGALAIVTTRSVDGGGEPVFDTEWQIFFRGEGGFGGDKGPETPPYAPKEGQVPDASVEMPTAETQALLYRLGSKDKNPIHADPDIARKVGFPKPILHGLCTFAHASRAVVRTMASGDGDRLHTIEGRFSKPVLPGDTLVTDVFRVGAHEAYFTSRVKERSEVVLTLGRATFRA